MCNNNKTERLTEMTMALHQTDHPHSVYFLNVVLDFLYYVFPFGSKTGAWQE